MGWNHISERFTFLIVDDMQFLLLFVTLVTISNLSSIAVLRLCSEYKQFVQHQFHERRYCFSLRTEIRVTLVVKGNSMLDLIFAGDDGITANALVRQWYSCQSLSGIRYALCPYLPTTNTRFCPHLSPGPYQQTEVMKFYFIFF